MQLIRDNKFYAQYRSSISVDYDSGGFSYYVQRRSNSLLLRILQGTPQIRILGRGVSTPRVHHPRYGVERALLFQNHGIEKPIKCKNYGFYMVLKAVR
jgi:hypothetical protein